MRRFFLTVLVLLGMFNLPAAATGGPTVTSVTFPAASMMSALYLKPGDTADLTVNFSAPVTISGSPTLTVAFEPSYTYDAPFKSLSDDGKSAVFSITANNQMCVEEGGLYGGGNTPNINAQGGSISSLTGEPAQLEISMDANVFFFAGGLWVECGPPVLEAVPGDRVTELYVFFSSEMTAALDPSWFSYRINAGESKPLKGARWDFSPRFSAIFELNEAPVVGDTVFLSYTPGGLRSVSGYDMLAFADQQIVYDGSDSGDSLVVEIDPSEYYEPLPPTNPIAPPSLVSPTLPAPGATLPGIPAAPIVKAPAFKALPAPNLNTSAKLRPQPAYNIKATDANERDYQREKRSTTVSWNKVAGATDYKIYYQGEFRKDWKLAKESVSKNTRSKLSELVSGVDVFLSVATVTPSGQSHDPSKGDLDFRQVDVGDHHACAVAKSGMVWCWGESQGYGELGDYSVGVGAKGVIVSGIKKATKVSVGDFHSCALDEGNVKCWGANFAGQLGKEGPDSAVAIEVKLPAKATDISAGDRHSCAVAGGKVYCWGHNGFGQVGAKGAKGVFEVPGLSAKSVSAGAFESCSVSSSGDLSCWGTNFEGTLATPTMVLTSVSQVSVGQSNVCAVTSKGEAYCRGEGSDGQLGNEATEDAADFVQVKLETKAKSISVGDGEACVVDTFLQIICWGARMPTFDFERSEAGVREYGLDRLFQSYADTSKPTITLNHTGYASLSHRKITAPRQIYEDGARDPQHLALGDSASCAVDYLGELYCNSEFVNGIKRSVFDNSVDELYASYGAVSDSPFLTLMGKDYYSVPGGKTVQNYQSKATPAITGTAKVGSTLKAKLPSWAPKAKDVGYLWLIADEPNGFYSVVSDARTASYKPRPQDAGKWLVLQIYSTAYESHYYEVIPSKPVKIAASTTSTTAPSPSGSALGWNKKLSDTQAKMYAKDIIGAGKVSFVLNGKEIAWVNAVDANDPKLRIVGENNYLVRTVDLKPGKNVLEIFIDGNKVKRTVYSR